MNGDVGMYNAKNRPITSSLLAKTSYGRAITSYCRARARAITRYCRHITRYQLAKTCYERAVTSY